MNSRSITQHVLAFASCFVAWPAWAATASVGAALPSPEAGGLDIHHINTGDGNATFFVFPDQTTLLIDCPANQDSTRAPRFKAPLRPDNSRLPAEWVARYIKRVHPLGPDAPVDYALVTHLHADHMGGIPELLRRVRVHTFLDRGWPDYTAPAPFGGALAGFYKGALAENVKQHGMKVERFRAGVADQIVLRREPARYPNFEVRQLAVNGEAWTGEGTTTRRRIDASEKNENALCAALRLRFGAFDYYGGGDLTGMTSKPDWPASRDMESAIAWVTGPVDAMLLNHHGNSDSSGPFFISVLQPRVCIAHVWDAQQVDPTTLGWLRNERLGPGPRDIFMTNGGWEGRDEHIVRVFGEAAGRKHIEDLKAVTQQGHVVVRVAPGGASYVVLMLEDGDESMRVKSVHGPYQSR
ncbi:MAG TPA: MBL fold metallo-hydrolase [Opitutaceae bacterium]|nr:MBL fold metallo-hydrolase [Opitutaceae bacterium]